MVKYFTKQDCIGVVSYPRKQSVEFIVLKSLKSEKIQGS